MNQDIALKVLGITYSQVQNGAYALLLAQVDGPFRIPVVVGASEAQSIAMRLEQVVPSRPLSHDLMVSMMHAYGIALRRVTIYRFEGGVFYSRLSFDGGNGPVDLDSRTSDAIALALRTNAPIFTTPEVLEETGFKMDDNAVAHKPLKLEDMPLSKLQKRLDQAVKLEKYELAAKIQKIIKERENASNDATQPGDTKATEA